MYTYIYVHNYQLAPRVGFSMLAPLVAELDTRSISIDGQMLIALGLLAVCMCVHIYLYVYISIYICMNIYIYVYKSISTARCRLH